MRLLLSLVGLATATAAAQRNLQFEDASTPAACSRSLESSDLTFSEGLPTLPICRAAALR